MTTETTKPDPVIEAEELLNDPKWSEPFGSDARRLLGRLCDEVRRLRAVVNIPPNERVVCDCHTWPTISEMHDYVVALERKIEESDHA